MTNRGVIARTRSDSTFLACAAVTKMTAAATDPCKRSKLEPDIATNGKHAVVSEAVEEEWRCNLR